MQKYITRSRSIRSTESQNFTLVLKYKIRFIEAYFHSITLNVLELMYFIYAIHNNLYLVDELFLCLESFETSDGFEMIVITDQLL